MFQLRILKNKLNCRFTEAPLNYIHFNEMANKFKQISNTIAIFEEYILPVCKDSMLGILPPESTLHKQVDEEEWHLFSLYELCFIDRY